MSTSSNLRPAVASAVALAAFPALAHHGPVGHPDLYLAENLIEFEGDIIDIFWRNPHPRMRMRVTEDDGSEKLWELELNNSPIGLRARGIEVGDFVRIGDHVRVAGVVALFDENALGVLHYMHPDGREYINGNREPRWTNSLFEERIQPPDPDVVAAARASARGIFRVWGGNVPGTGAAHPPVSLYQPYLTALGAEIEANWNRATDDGELECRQGMPGAMFDPTPIEFIDEGDRIVMLGQEYDIRRIIHMNVDPASAPAENTDLGYSVGRWQDDTLVVRTTHVGWPQFDPYGTPQSEQATYVETFRFDPADETLHYSFTSTDPVMFTQPIRLSRQRRWTPGYQIVPLDCATTRDECPSGLSDRNDTSTEKAGNRITVIFVDALRLWWRRIRIAARRESTRIAASIAATVVRLASGVSSVELRPAAPHAAGAGRLVDVVRSRARRRRPRFR
ncbi:MAG TPA: DUF6152 family protein [Gammaproteobacteria bacterium]